MNSKQIKRHYKITEMQLQRLRLLGMPCEVNGKRYSYDKDKIDVWCQENKVELLGYVEKELISIVDLQEILNVSSFMTDKWVELGCPRIKVNEKKYLYRMEDLTEWLGLGRLDKNYVGSLMDTKELADEFFVSVWTIRQWVKKGMPHYNFNTRVFRYDLEHVQEWLDNEQ